MQFPQFSSCGLLSILVCWLSVNDAVPLGSYPAGQVRPTIPSLPETETVKTPPIAVELPLRTGTQKSLNDRPYRSTDSTRHSSYVSNQDDVKEIHGELTESRQGHLKTHQSSVITSKKDSNDTEIDSDNDDNSRKSKQKDPEKWEIPQKKKEVPDTCVNDEHRQNQIYTRSIPPNRSSINVAEDFKIAGESEAKKTSSVHIGEDIALCWTETTTIKEDPEFNPPKRLVIREFTISFENSASIPDSYLECNELEGEIALGDEDTVSKTALHEVIDQNTKRSREVNFTHVSHIGRIIVRQHKKVKCGVGAVVSKDIFEWPDGTDNPKKRVEIKVGPSIRDLGVVSDDKPAECIGKSIPNSPQAGHSQSSSPDCTSSETGDCSSTVTVSTCEDNDYSTGSSSEETVPTTFSSNSNEVLSTGVTGETTTTNPILKKLLSPLPHKPERDEDDSCLEFDTDCISSKTTTVHPESDDRKSGNCSGEDCSGESSDGSTREVPCDQRKDASCLCSGDNCASEEQSTTGTEGSVEITTKNGELCNNSSESCNCNGSACSVHGSEESVALEFGDKQTDEPTMSSAYETNETTTESSAESSDSKSPSEKDSGCDGECSVSSQSYSDEEDKDIGTTSAAPVGKNSNDGPSAKQNVETEISDVNGVTEPTRAIGDSSRTETTKPCGDGSGPEGCSTVIPVGANSLDEVPEETEYFSPTQGTSSSETTEDRSQPSRSDLNETEVFSSCAESDEGCGSSDSSNESVPVSKPFDITTDSMLKGSETTTILPTSEKPDTVTNRLNDKLTMIPDTKTDEETRTIKPSTESTDSGTSSDEQLSSDKDSVTECSASSEGSGDCSKITATPSSDLTDTTMTSPSTEVTTLPPQSCESSGNCGSTNGTSSSDETNQAMSTIATERTKNSSICDDSNESCESSSSSINASEDCVDGSTDCRSGSASPRSESCDSPSGSCSSEAIDTEMQTTQSTPEKFEPSSTINDTVSTTAETRRSIVSTTPLSSPVKGHHRLALRIKVLLEHIDENKEKEQLVQVERHLLLNEKPSEHGNHSLTLQLQSLNNSMNMETLKAIFNCTTLENLSQDVINLDQLSKDVINLKEVGQKTEGKVSLNKQTGDSSVEDSVSQTNDDEQYDSTDRSDENSPTRKKRAILIPVNSTTGVKNITDRTKEKAILESLPGVHEDFQNGMDHVLYRISKALDDSATSEVNKTAESSSSKILQILSDPSNSRVHSRSPRRTSRVDRVVSVEELEAPISGEEIERWSKERFVGAADGGQIRSLTEFRILRDHSENPSGL